MQSFARNVERWRSLFAEYAGGIPVDFLLAWIERESAGRSNVRTELDERGIFQLHPSEAEALGLSSADFDRLLRGTPHDAAGVHQVTVGLQLVRYLMRRAETFLAAVGSTWTGGSLLRMTKFSHALPRAAKELPQVFQQDHGRGPADWWEMIDYAYQLADRTDARLAWIARYDRTPPKTIAGGIKRLTKNSEHAGYYVDGGRPNRGDTLIAGASSGGSVGFSLAHAAREIATLMRQGGG